MAPAAFISSIGFGAAVLMLCCFAAPIGNALGVVDHPDGIRKRHIVPTPLVGGIALMLPLTLVAVAESLRGQAASELFLVYAAAGFGFMLLGWFDDRNHVSPASRLVAATALSLVIVVSQPDLRLDTLEFGAFNVPLGYLAIPFTLLCLVGLQNAVNMADGLNGLLAALCVFWVSVLLLYAPEQMTTYLVFLLLGLLILLPFNLAGRLFLGDAGSYSLGIIVGLAMIHVYKASPQGLPMLTVAL